MWLSASIIHCKPPPPPPPILVSCRNPSCVTSSTFFKMVRTHLSTFTCFRCFSSHPLIVLHFLVPSCHTIIQRVGTKRPHWWPRQPVYVHFIQGPCDLFIDGLVGQRPNCLSPACIIPAIHVPLCEHEPHQPSIASCPRAPLTLHRICCT